MGYTFHRSDQELWERTNTGPGITDRMTNLRCPLATRTTCTQGLPPTLSDPDPVKGAMETDFFPRATREVRGRPGGEEYPPPDPASGCVPYTQEPALGGREYA